MASPARCSHTKTPDTMCPQPRDTSGLLPLALLTGFLFFLFPHSMWAKPEPCSFPLPPQCSALWLGAPGPSITSGPGATASLPRLG